VVGSSGGGIPLSVQRGGVEVMAWGGEGGELVGGMRLGEGVGREERVEES